MGLEIVLREDKLRKTYTIRFLSYVESRSKNKQKVMNVKGALLEEGPVGVHRGTGKGGVNMMVEVYCIYV
jgi:hypothetical protein